MTDLTQGAQAPVDDSALFDDITNATTLEKFENAVEPIPPPQQKAVVEEKPAEAEKPPVEQPPDAMVPSSRLREVNEARQRAERERDELMRQMVAMRQPQQPQQPPQPKPDVFENPSGFVQSEVRPYFERIQAEMQMQREAFSQQMASSAYGNDKVTAARQALENGMRQGDPNARSAWEQAMQSGHPYDVITRWHLNNETMREVGGDLNSYKQRILEEAKNNPDYQRQVIEASKGHAQHVARPASVQSSVPKIPSLGNVGAGGGETDLQEPSDEQLFRAAISARRK